MLRIKLHILSLKPAPPLHAWFRAGSTAHPAVRTTGTVPRPSPSPSLPVRSTRGCFSSSSKLALKIQRLEAVGDAALARRAEPVSHVCTSALLASHSSARYQLRAPAVMRAGECGRACVGAGDTMPGRTGKTAGPKVRQPWAHLPGNLLSHSVASFSSSLRQGRQQY